MDPAWLTATSPPPLEPGHIHIWRYRLDQPLENLTGQESLLAPGELDRASRYLFPLHRNRFIVGRAQLRKILGGYLGTPPAAISFAYSEFGRPTLSPILHPAGFAFNVSHSEDLWLLAVSLTPVLGIDVERFRTDFGGEDIARSNFAPNEFRELMSLPERVRPQAFFNCWTRKEAYVKALGGGLQIPLDSFEVTLRPGDPPKFLRGASDDWNLLSFVAEEGYQAAVACQRRVVRPLFFELAAS